MKKRNKWRLILVLTGNFVLFQNCSGGFKPSQLVQTSQGFSDGLSDGNQDEQSPPPNSNDGAGNPGSVGGGDTFPPPPPPIVPVDGVVYVPSFAQPSVTGDLLGFVLQNPYAQALPEQMISFGQPFVAGQLPSSSQVEAVYNGQVIPVQIDVKTTNADGSVRFAVLSMRQPALAANTSASMLLRKTTRTVGAAVDLSDLSNYSFVVDLNFTGSTTRSFSINAGDKLKAALTNKTASFWLKGPIASQARVEVAVVSSLRLVFDVTKYSDGTYVTHAQFNNDIAMTLDGNDLTYSTVIRAHGSTMNWPSRTHFQYQQWQREVYSAGKPLVNVQHDPYYMIRAKAILPYNIANGVDGTILNDFAKGYQSFDHNDPWAIHGLTQYMPTTGGRFDIGPNTGWATIWIVSQDARARDVVLAQAETASVIPWHYYDATNKRWLNTDDYPNLWTDARGGVGTPGDPRSYGLTRQAAGTSNWVPDTAHQPNLSFVPYIMTGKRYHLDQLNAAASFDIMSLWNAIRHNWDIPLNGKSYVDIVVHEGGQLRSGAWSLRLIQLAAYFGADNTFEKDYYKRVTDHNYEYMMARTPELQAKTGEVYGYFRGVYGTDGVIPPWQNDFLLSTVYYAANMGHANAINYLNWSKNYFLGRMMDHTNYIWRDGIVYLWPAFETVNGATRYYQTWSEVGSKISSLGWSNGVNDWPQARGGNFGQLVMMSTRLIYDLTKDTNALAISNRLDQSKVPYCDAAYFRRDPTLSMRPPQ